jgi:hypothetical protein
VIVFTVIGWSFSGTAVRPIDGLVAMPSYRHLLADARHLETRLNRAVEGRDLHVLGIHPETKRHDLYEVTARPHLAKSKRPLRCCLGRALGTGLNLGQCHVRAGDDRAIGSITRPETAAVWAEAVRGRRAHTTTRQKAIRSVFTHSSR